MDPGPPDKPAAGASPGIGPRRRPTRDAAKAARAAPSGTMAAELPPTNLRRDAPGPTLAPGSAKTATCRRQSPADPRAPIKRPVGGPADVFLRPGRAPHAGGSTRFVDGGMLRTI